MINRPEANFLLQMILDRLENICRVAVIRQNRLDLLEKVPAQFDEDPELIDLQEIGLKLVEEHRLDELWM